MKPLRLAIRVLLWIVLRTTAVVLLGVSAAFIYVVSWGLPAGLTARVLREANARGSFVVEADSIRLDPAMGLALRNVRVFRKGRVGPAGVQAESLRITPDFPALLEGRLCVSSIDLRNGAVHTDLLAGPAAEPAGKGGGDAQLNFDMRVRVRDCTVQGIRFRDMTCRLESFGPIVRTDDLEAVVESGGASGEVRGYVAYDTFGNVLRGTVRVQADPKVLIPTLQRWEMGDLVELVKRFAFGNERPFCNLDFVHFGGRSPLVRATGSFNMSEFRYRDVPILRADGRFRALVSDAKTEVDIQPLLLVREEGTLRGNIRMDISKGLVDFDADSTLTPPALAKMLDLVSDDFLSYFAFNGEVRLKIRGTADLTGQRRTNITGEMTGHSARVWKLLADEFSCEIETRGATNTIRRLRGRALGGDLYGKVVVVTPTPEATNLSYTVAISLSEAEFKQFARAIMDSGSEDYSGRMSFFTKITGELNDRPLASIRGRGGFRVKEGRVFMLPIFGGFTTYMTRVIPGLDLVLRQSEAKMTFEVANGKIRSDRIEIEGGVLTLTGRGSCVPYPKTDLDYHIQVKLLRDNLIGNIVRLPTWFISKLFEFRLRGSIDEPRWYLVNFSGDLLTRLGLRKETHALKPIDVGRKTPTAQPAPKPEESWGLPEPN